VRALQTTTERAPLSLSRRESDFNEGGVSLWIVERNWNTVLFYFSLGGGKETSFLVTVTECLI
jgi:hypothetical protein